MLRLDFKSMFRKENSKIYNFSVETEFKFALKGAQKGSTDTMKEVHRAGGHEARMDAESWGRHRVGETPTDQATDQKSSHRPGAGLYRVDKISADAVFSPVPNLLLGLRPSAQWTSFIGLVEPF